jgi:hypothetical protein
LINEYIKLGGGTSHRVVDGLWDAFGSQTADLMGLGARYLATIWDAAYTAAGSPVIPASVNTISETILAKIYQTPSFVPSLPLKKIGDVLM